jgi:hypothetical protein
LAWHGFPPVAVVLDTLSKTRFLSSTTPMT